jgi:dTDP-4-amino-4,6-dideoxygalactose transaminase
LEQCLETGQVTNNGRHVQEFEAKLTDYLEAPTLAFNSGMSALTAMLLAADVRGGEVILPSFTFPATVQAVILAGATPVFADIDEETWTIDSDDVWQRVTHNTKAILGVDVYGIPCDYGDFADLCEDEGLLFLMDSAPAFGSRARCAHAQIFSFHATKPFTTMEGGCLCASDYEIWEKAKAIRNFGQRDNGENLNIGINGKMLEICALIGLEKLQEWDVVASQRKSAAASLRLALGKIEEIGMPFPAPMDSPIWTYCPILPDFAALQCTREEFMLGLYAKGIETRTYYGACHKFYGSEAQLPITDDIASRVVALPVYNDMTAEEIDYIAAAVKDLVGEALCKVRTSSSSVVADISESPSVAS